MSRTLHYYQAARKDIGLNNYPHRKENGEFKFTLGQEEILTEERFKSIRKTNTEIEHLNKRTQYIKREMLAYQDPTGKLAADGDRLSANWQPEIDEEELRLKELKQEQKQFTDDMLKLGIVIPERKAKEEIKRPNEKGKNGGFAFKNVLSFLGIWVVGEIFMTYVQWNALRNDKGIEDMVVRSLSFGVILFLVHLVAHFNRNSKRLVYPVFIGFNLVMLMTMLFAPLIINKIYPSGYTAQGVSQQWSLINSTRGQASGITIKNPLWIEVYRENETIPAILCFIFFVAMQSFMSTKNKVEAPTVTPEQKPETDEDRAINIMEYRAEKIQECERTLKELKAKQHQDVKENTGGLQQILIKLEAMKTECMEIDTKVSALKTAKEELLTDLDKELNEYNTIFSEVLRKDEVKTSLVSVEWQTSQDIINYYKIQAV